MQVHRFSLRELRLAKGLTVSKVAADAGIKQPHLSNIELGNRQASDEVIIALASALQVSVQAIITCPEPKSAA